MRGLRGGGAESGFREGSVVEVVGAVVEALRVDLLI